MNPKGREFFAPAGFFGRRLLPWLFLAPVCALLTGCPHNDYTVELKPTAHGVERTLTFYRVDGNSSNGVPNYQGFPSNELVAITKAYPANTVIRDGQRHIAKAEFSGAMPKDVGGAGAYTNYVTSLGESGFYSERFRGDDDLAGRTLKQFHAADQLTDLVIGWSKTEFGHERGYKKLRKFLDEDFRHDLKNAGEYFKMAAASNLSDTNTPEEFTVRFFQYLVERGYLKLSDLPKLPLIASSAEADEVPRLIQRLVAEKMEIPAAGPMPKSLGILTNNSALEKSWGQYMARTDLYRAQRNAWEEKRKKDPDLKEPKPGDATEGLTSDLLGIPGDLGGETDHLTVKLALKHAPDHSNGKWQDGRVVWEMDLEHDRPLPVLCYASWNDPDETFQKAHFGRRLLEGDELAHYNLWRSGLSQPGGEAWDNFLAGLQPGPGLKEKIQGFRLTNDAEPLDVGCNLLTDALTSNATVPPAGPSSK
ncbi:MAG: hypothetical protein P4N60_20735 [Verrucomicrobiae bacterium]|nr:hypothetical protein [Verrucomicrobiae bacterium]